MHMYIYGCIEYVCKITNRVFSHNKPLIIDFESYSGVI